MNTVAFFCFVVMGVNLYYGVKRGFVKMILPLLANILTLIFFSCTRALWGKILFQWVFDEASLVGVRVLVLLLIYIICMALIKLLIHSLNRLAELPGLHFFNTVMGILTGIIQGFLLIWIFFAIIYLFREGSLGTWALPQIQQHPYLTFLYEHNLITYIIAEFV